MRKRKIPVRRMTMLPVKKLYTTVNRTKKRNKKNLYIVIHWVGAVSSAYNNAKYFQNVYRGSSAHYFVDDKNIYQIVKDSDASWHCGAKKYFHKKCRNKNGEKSYIRIVSVGKDGKGLAVWKNQIGMQNRSYI